MKSLKLLFSIICLLSNAAFAQYTTLGTGTFGGTLSGPVRMSTTDSNYYSRYAFIYPEVQLNALEHGDTISSFELSTLAGYAPDGNTLLDVYVSNTTLTDFTTQSPHWDSMSKNSTLIFSGSLLNILDGNAGFHKFSVNNNSWTFDTTKGKNLRIFFDFRQTDTQGGLVQFNFDNTNLGVYTGSSTRYYFGNTKSDSLNNNAAYHPQMILNYPRKDKEIALLATYSLGKMPVPLGNPDSVRVLIRNTGKKPIVNEDLYLTISGANSRKDTTKLNLGIAQQQFLTLDAVSVNKFGIDSILVHSDFGMPMRDSVWTFRNDNFNVYSYENPVATGNAGGIGFNGTTGDFVARFFSNSSKTINQITVSFGQGNRPFRLGVWDDSRNGKPGSLIWESDSLNSVAGKYILDIKKPVKVSGNFYAGVRQMGTVNVAFGYQREQPVRPNTFLYAAPLDDTSWIDFAPNAPFRFLIEPRIQADTDLVVSQSVLPRDTFNTVEDTSFYPECIVKNIGVHDVNTPFSVRCIMRRFNNVYYDESTTDTLYSGGSKNIKFTKKVLPRDNGDNQVTYIVSYTGDQVRDNDTLNDDFFVGFTKDVGFNTVYTPTNDDILKYQIDTIQPLCVFGNNGYDQTTTFNIRCEMVRDTTVLYNETIRASFTPYETRFLIFSTYTCSDTGRIQVRYISEMPDDRFSSNDTVIRNVRVLKLRDMAVIGEGNPLSTLFYKTNQALSVQGRVENQGLITEFDNLLSSEIKSNYTNSTYFDTVRYDAQAAEIKNVSLANYTPPVKGVYNATFITKDPDDVYTDNDTISYSFNVGHPFDYMVKSIDFPLDQDSFTKEKGKFLAPKATFRNEGFRSPPGLVPIICEIWKNNTRVFYDIKSTNLDTSENLPITFPNTFDLGEAGKYLMRCMTNFNGDLNRPNDTLEIEFTVKVGTDAQVVSIDSPATAFAKITKDSFKATVQNNGFNPMTNLTLILEKNNVFEDSIKVNLDPYEQKSVTFSTLYEPENPGFDQLSVYFAYEPDGDEQNDTLRKNIPVRKKYDAEIRLNNAFCQGDYSANDDSAQVSYTIENLGVDTVKNGSVRILINEMGQPAAVLDETQPFADLFPGESRPLLSNGKMYFTKVAQYTVLTYLVPDAQDLFSSNDSANCAITVKVNSIAPIWAKNITISPNPTNYQVSIANLPEQSTASLWNSNGQLIKSEMPKTMDIQHLSAGIYFIKIELNGAFATYKLAIE